MIHPLLRLIATRPELLAEHGEAYAELLAEEAGVWRAQWMRRALCGAVALACGVLALTLAGVAGMLWAVTAPENLHAPWALFVVPAVPLVMALGAFGLARAEASSKPFEALRSQLRADIAMLREARSS